MSRPETLTDSVGRLLGMIGKDRHPEPQAKDLSQAWTILSPNYGVADLEGILRVAQDDDSDD